VNWPVYRAFDYLAGYPDWRLNGCRSENAANWSAFRIKLSDGTGFYCTNAGRVRL